MPTITLLRHGQASFGTADYDVLSDLGRRQSAVAGRELARRGLHDALVVCGSLRRQRDTAVAVTAALGRTDQPVSDPRFDEYDHLGLVGAHTAAEGLPAPADPRAFQAMLDVALRRWVEADQPDGWRRFAGDAVTAVEELAATLQGRDAVVVTSGGVIAAICRHLLDGGAATVVALNRVVVNAAFTTLLAGRTGLHLVTFNDHAHLTGANAMLRTYR